MGKLSERDFFLIQSAGLHRSPLNTNVVKDMVNMLAFDSVPWIFLPPGSQHYEGSCQAQVVPIICHLMQNCIILFQLFLMKKSCTKNQKCSHIGRSFAIKITLPAMPYANSWLILTAS